LPFFAIHADNVGRARTFYEKVLGWRFEEWGPPDFYLIKTGNEQSPGILGAVLKSAGECSEIIYETYCISNAFSFTGKQGQVFIHIATYAKHVNIGFDRETMLVSRGQIVSFPLPPGREKRFDHPGESCNSNQHQF